MKQIVFLIITIFLLVIIGNMSMSILSLWSKKDVLTQTKEQLAQEQQEHTRLEKQWQVVQSPSFIEEQARDKLFLGKPGESVVLFPAATPSANTVQVLQDIPVWEQWWNLFF